MVALLFRRSRIALGAQAAGIVSAFLLIALAPPARGAILVVPLGKATQGRLAQIAIGHGAAILGRGLMAGSLVVRGDRARLLGPMMKAGALLTAAPQSLCAAGVAA